jgi:hypothetical protein
LPRKIEGQGLRNVALEIHAPMQDADDIDAVGGQAVEQEMRAAGNFVIARANVRAFLSNRRTRRYFLNSLPNIAGVRFRLIRSPVVGGLIPNFVKISLSAR